VWALLLLRQWSGFWQARIVCGMGGKAIANLLAGPLRAADVLNSVTHRCDSNEALAFLPD
jgi:hypothetical protein